MKLGLGTIVKILSDGHKGMMGVVIKCDDLPPWAECYVELENGSRYSFSKDEIQVI